VLTEAGVKVPYLVGTMIETPRAALTAGEIAQVAEFFSYGTNDLTQMTMGLSRDDAGRFLPDYVDVHRAAIFAEDPFQSLDVAGVGKLVELSIRDGRAARPKLKIGICGEHGGDPASVRFCHRVGMDYVSCSPFRVPIARLAAAQAVIEAERAGGKPRAGKPGDRRTTVARKHTKAPGVRAAGKLGKRAARAVKSAARAIGRRGKAGARR
jgi:pyruvate,orthophosphate dikinase